MRGWLSKGEFLLYKDAIERSTCTIISRLIDDVRVTVAYDGWYETLNVRIEGRHRDRNYGQTYDISAAHLSPEFYSEYLRERLPNDLGKRFADYILRGH